MSVKSFSSKIIQTTTLWSTLCLLLLLLPVIKLRAQEAVDAAPRYIVQRDTVYITVRDTILLPADTVYLPLSTHTSSTHRHEVKQSTPRPNHYDRRVHRYRQRWEAFIPTHFKVQYAGNMGLLSVGTGWDYGKRNQWETDVFLGFLPRYESKKTKITFTVKQNFMPWSFHLGDSDFDFEPLTTGLYLNTVLGDEFWASEPDRYPSGYYGFSSRVRIHVFAGQRITWQIPPGKRFSSRELTFFYELSTCDLYVVSAFGNRHLKPQDYLSLSFGVKLQLL